MSESDSVAQLRTFGLNLYESRAYVALLKAKQLTPKGLGQSTLIPQSRTYDILESLARKGFAVSTPASPPSYIPVPPSKVISSCYNSERRKIQDRVSKVYDEAQAKLESVHDAYVTLTKDFPTLAEEQTPQDRVWVLQTRESIEDTLIGLIREAKSDVLRITKPPELKDKEPFDPFYIVGMENQRYVNEALERGVEMKWLSLAREIPTVLGLNVQEPPERRYLERDQDITEKFLLVDKHSVLLNLHDPASPAYGYVALAMQSRAVSSIFLDHFDKLWKRGRRLNDVLHRMKTLVNDLCVDLGEAGLGRTEIALYKTLAKSGASTQEVVLSEMMKKRIQSHDTLVSCERLMQLGLIHRDSVSRLLMVEPPANVRAFLLAGKLRVGSEARLTTGQGVSGKNL